MENASKALIMAGGVLIALLVIGLLVMFFNNLSDLQRIEQSGEDVQKASEFNKPYDVYARNVYGSELLSIANIIIDYNKRESNNKGYTEVELEVTISNEKNPNKDIFNKGKNEKYNAQDFGDIKNDIDKKIKEFSNRNPDSEMLYKSKNGKYSRTIDQLATMRTNEIAKLLDIEENGPIMQEIQEKISEYYTYKNLLSEIKQKVFTYKGFEYDEYTGRIVKMKYEL